MATAAVKQSFPRIAEAFDLPKDAGDIEDLVKNFDFSKLKVSTSKKAEYLNFGLAPSYGTLNSESLRKMDDELKIMIAGTTKAISKLQNKSWENVISTLQQNPLLEPIDAGINRSDKFIKDMGTSAFKFDGSPDASIAKEVNTWFRKLIDDEDILNSTGIDIKVLANIVASSGAAVDSFEAFFAKKEYHEQTMLEIGVLRYPDIDHPYFKVYRIKLTAWSDSARVLFVQDDKNGITGDFSVRRYKPRDSVISGLKEETKQKAIQEAEDLFGF